MRKRNFKPLAPGQSVSRAEWNAIVKYINELQEFSTSGQGLKFGPTGVHLRNYQNATTEFWAQVWSSGPPPTPGGQAQADLTHSWYWVREIIYDVKTRGANQTWTVPTAGRWVAAVNISEIGHTGHGLLKFPSRVIRANDALGANKKALHDIGKRVVMVKADSEFGWSFDAYPKAYYKHREADICQTNAAGCMTKGAILEMDGDIITNEFTFPNQFDMGSCV
jgi:hypothetical protein